MKCSSATLAASLALALAAGAVPAGTEAGKATPAPAAGAKAGEAAIASFSRDPSLKVELYAAEPLLANGVAFSQDEKGRWYIAETYRQEKGVEDNRVHGNWLNDDLAARTTADRLAMIKKFYPNPAKFKERFATAEDRIVRVEDTTGAGRADRSTIFADGFRDPLDGTGAGILARGNDVWWTCIPNLWRFKAGPDGQAQTREKLLSGFGIKFAFRGHDMHGLRFGPDGKLYFSIGDRGIHVETKEGKVVTEPDTGSIMRCNPDGTGFEVFATGVRNPQELAFDEFGNLFTGDNNSDGGDKARFAYVVEGGDYGWRMTYQYLNDRGPWNRERLWDEREAHKAKYLVPPIANIGNGPSGLAYNPGTGLSDAHKGRFFMADFRGGATVSVTHEILLEPKGAFFKIKEAKEFVKGVLNTDVEFGNDGKLYVLDWVESWGGVNKGRIYKFTDPAGNSTLQAETKKLIEEGMEKKTPPELGGLLGHPDQRVRQAAQFELVRRVQPFAPGNESLAVLGKMARAGQVQLARIHAIWGLGQLATGSPVWSAPNAAVVSLETLLADPDAEVRAQAARVAGDSRSLAAAEKLVTLLKDPAARPRMYAALALGKLAHKPAVDALFALLAENKGDDPVLRHAAVMGLTAAASAEQLAAKARDASVQVRIGALLALRRQRSADIAGYLADADPSVILETARAIYDAPIEGALPALGKLSTRKDIKDPHVVSRVLNAHYRLGKAPNAVALAVYAADSAMPEAGRRVALDALSDWGTPSPRDRILNLHRPLPDRGPDDAVAAISAAIPSLLKDASPGLQQSVAILAARLKIQSAGDSLFGVAMNAKATPASRISAIRGLAALKDPRLLEVARAAARDPNPNLRSQGLQALAGADPAAVVTAIAEIVNTGKPVEKQGALSALAQVKSPAAAALISNLLDRLLAGGAAPEIQLEILDAARRANTPELNQKLKAYEASLPATDPLAPYRVALAGGNLERGRKIFREKAEVQCQRCHKCETGDSQVGPDLTRIGATKDRVYLLESIVTPNKHIAQGFETVVVTLQDKSVVAGRVVKSDAKNLTLEVLDEKGKPKSVTMPVATIVNRTGAPSPMPEALRDFLSKAELRDLVEYLATRK
jgi:quinoprotein glucose dehydrogenase